MPANNTPPATNPRDQLDALMNETFGERTPRKLFKLSAAEFGCDQGADAAELFEEFFYLSDEEAVEVCRGLINSLKPYASRRADREGRPKNATGPTKASQGRGNNNNNNKRGEQSHSEERELVNT